MIPGSCKPRRAHGTERLSSWGRHCPWGGSCLAPRRKEDDGAAAGVSCFLGAEIAPGAPSRKEALTPSLRTATGFLRDDPGMGQGAPPFEMFSNLFPATEASNDDW